jgi:hypothetical protein
MESLSVAPIQCYRTEHQIQQSLLASDFRAEPGNFLFLSQLPSNLRHGRLERFALFTHSRASQRLDIFFQPGVGESFDTLPAGESDLQCSVVQSRHLKPPASGRCGLTEVADAG